MMSSVQQHPASVDAYIRHGWSLVPIPMGTKGPRTQGWNLKENALRSQADLPPGYGIGLAHAYSGTMALDVDNWIVASMLLKEHGVDLHDLYNAPDAVVIESGKPGHGKLLYALPAPLPSKKISHGGITAYELRCATSSGLTVQDVLPPSIHPEMMQPYTWAGKGSWTSLPVIPDALLTIWNSLLAADAERTISSGTPVDASWEEIRQALDTIPPDCSRDEWISVGMALHWAGTQTGQVDQAMALWTDWSRPSDKFPGERGIMQQWTSFRLDKTETIKLGTLFHIASTYGWVRPTPDVTGLFDNVKFKPLNPLDILDGLRPRAPKMRLDLWPSILRQRAEEISESMGCDPIIPLFAGLAAVCGAVDAQMRLELMPGFKVPPVLWLMTLGDPADKKTPGSRPMFATLKQLELEDRPRYAKDLLAWEGQEAAHCGAKKAFLEWSASPEAMLGGNQGPVVPPQPPRPVELCISVTDISSQKLVYHAANRPRGLLCYLDEMNGWVKKITDPRSGEDRSSWVVAYEAETHRVDRVGAGSVILDHYAVSIYGNMQPAVFEANLAALAADGLLQRFVPAVIDPSQTRLGNPVPDYLTCETAWDSVLRLTYALPVQTYRLSPEAYTLYRDFQRWYEEAKQDERVIGAGSAYMTAFGKLEGLAGRLALLFHIIESPFSSHVSADVMERVIDLVRGYVIPAYRYTLSGLIRDDFDAWMVNHIVSISGEKQTVSIRDLKHSARRPLDGKSDWQKENAIIDAMVTLERADWVIPLETDTTRRKYVWAINPNLAKMFQGYREQRTRAMQRHVDYIYRVAYEKGYKRKFVKGYDPSMDEE